MPKRVICFFVRAYTVCLRKNVSCFLKWIGDKALGDLTLDDAWCLDGDSSGRKYKISELDSERDKEKIFYKTRWIKEEGTVHTDHGDKKQVIEQKLIVSYSIK